MQRILMKIRRKQGRSRHPPTLAIIPKKCRKPLYPRALGEWW